jgi:ABC-type sugar transport system permease subunit
VLWTVVTVPVQLILGLGLALVLDNAVRGRTAYRAAFFMPAVLSSAVISFAWSWIYSPQDGGATRFIQALGGTGQTWLADTSTAIWAAIGVSAWRYSGLIMLFYLAAMQMVPKELYEAAAIDGASWWRRVTNVTLPQLLPTTVLLILFGVIGALREFEVIYLLTRGGPAHATDLMSLQIFDQAFNQSRPGYGATISTALLLFTAVLAIPLLGLIGTAQRRRG